MSLRGGSQVVRLTSVGAHFDNGIAAVRTVSVPASVCEKPLRIAAAASSRTQMILAGAVAVRLPMEATANHHRYEPFEPRRRPLPLP